MEKKELEVTLKQKEKEIESLKLSAGEDSAQVKEMIAKKEKEYEDIKKQLETLECKLECEREKVSHLQVEKIELQKNLDQKDQEIQYLKKSSEEKEELLKEIIAIREQQVQEHKEKLKKVEDELESKKNETTHLQECFLKVTVELEGKKVLARQLQETKDEMSSQLKEEREKIDMLLRNSMAVKASPESHAIEIEVITYGMFCCT